MPTNRSRRDFLKKSAALVLGTTTTTGSVIAPAPCAVAFENAASGSATVPASTTSMFDGFKPVKIQTRDATINVVVGGSGPPVLLLHGYPQRQSPAIRPLLAGGGASRDARGA
jgi:haloacetate dehalogenase